MKIYDFPSNNSGTDGHAGACPIPPSKTPYYVGELAMLHPANVVFSFGEGSKKKEKMVQYL